MICFISYFFVLTAAIYLWRFFFVYLRMAKFELGNKVAEKWTEDEAINAFENMLQYAIDESDVLSVQQAYLDSNMHPATYYYLAGKFPVLEDIKKGISDVIISRVNKGAIKNEMNPTACIWRMKQLGERDSRDINQTVDDKRKTVNELFPTDDELNEEDQP